MIFAVLLICALVVGFHLLVPSQTQTMLRDWEEANGTEILAAEPVPTPWSFKWGAFSQAQRFVRVSVRDVRTGARSEMVLCLGGLVLGLKVKRVRVCEARPIDMA